MEQRNKIIFSIALVVLIVIAFVLLLTYQPKSLNNDALNNMVVDNNQPTDNSQDVFIDQPKMNSKISSHVKLSGRIRGTWFFEASLPIKIVDGNGQVLGSGTAQAQDSWMTEDLVRFTAEINFLPPETATGQIIIEADNPSGDPLRDRNFIVPVSF